MSIRKLALVSVCSLYFADASLLGSILGGADAADAGCPKEKEGSVGWVDKNFGPYNTKSPQCVYFKVPVNLDGAASGSFTIQVGESAGSAINKYCSSFDSFNVNCDQQLKQLWRAQHADYIRGYDASNCPNAEECVQQHFQFATEYAGKGFNEEASQELLHVYTTRGPEKINADIDYMLAANLLITDRLEQAMAAWDLAYSKNAPSFETIPEQVSIPNHPFVSSNTISYPNTTRFRLKHDITQFHHLAAQGVFTLNFAAYVTSRYTQVLNSLGGESKYTAEGAFEVLTLDNDQWSLIAPYYNRALYKYPLAKPANTELFNSGIDWDSVQTIFLRNNLVVVDDLFNPLIAAEFNRFTEQSTVFNVIHPQRRSLLSFAEFGLSNNLIAQFVNELRVKAPFIFCNLLLQQVFAEKHDDLFPTPIAVNADDAAVSVNLWFSRDERSTVEGVYEGMGGLVFYRATAGDLASPNFNAEAVQNYTIPYRANRAVFYNSEFLHGLGGYNVRPGYTNRRVDWTLLLGRPGEKCKLPTAPAPPQ